MFFSLALIGVLAVAVVAVQMSAPARDDLFKQHIQPTVQAFAVGDPTDMCQSGNVLRFDHEYATCTARPVGQSDMWSIVATFYRSTTDAESGANNTGRVFIVVERRCLTSVLYQRAGGQPFE